MAQKRTCTIEQVKSAMDKLTAFISNVKLTELQEAIDERDELKKKMYVE